MDKETWLAVNAGQVKVLKEVMTILEDCHDLNHAQAMLVVMHDLYALSSWPGGLKKSAGSDDVSPASIRRRRNDAWESGY